MKAAVLTSPSALGSLPFTGDIDMNEKEKEFIIKRMSALGYIDGEYEAAPGIPKNTFAGQMILLRQMWEVLKWTFLFEVGIMGIKEKRNG